jgi:leader peptidase (prepilin peptidase)/N-methyltransferase
VITGELVVLALGVAGSVGLGLLVGGSVIPRVTRPWTTLDRAHRHYAVVVATGALFGAMTARLGADVVLPAYWLLVTALVAIVAIDLERHLIPNRVVYPVLAIGVVLLTLATVIEGTPTRLWHATLGGVLAFAALGLVHLAQPRALGFGDLRLGLVAGVFLGWLSLRLVLLGFVLAFAAAALVAVVLLLSRRRGFGERIAFAPFLALGQLLAIFLGSYGRHP